MDIKELALKIADSLDPTAGKGCGKNYILTPNNVAELCTRFLAAYTEGQEPVAWDGAEEWEQLAWNLCAEEGGEESCTELLWDGGPIPEPWGDRWLKYEGEAKRMISLVRKFTAPPIPAIPDHLCLVPRVPTKEMVAASWHAAGSVRFGDGQEKYIAVAYQAMIAAGEVK